MQMCTHVCVLTCVHACTLAGARKHAHTGLHSVCVYTVHTYTHIHMCTYKCTYTVHAHTPTSFCTRLSTLRGTLSHGAPPPPPALCQPVPTLWPSTRSIYIRRHLRLPRQLGGAGSVCLCLLWGWQRDPRTPGISKYRVLVTRRNPRLSPPASSPTFPSVPWSCRCAVHGWELQAPEDAGLQKLPEDVGA